MEFLKDTDLPQGIVAVGSLLQAVPQEGVPLVWREETGSDTRLDLPENGRLTLVEILPEKAESRFSVSLGRGAHLNHIRIIAQGADTHYRAEVGPEAALELSTLILEGDSQNDYTVDCYRGSRTALYGLALPAGNEQVANRIRLHHKEPHGQSDQIFKYVADGHAKAVFDGKIVVEKDAQKIQAYQKNNNILLSATARVESDPQLEIYADDVRCSHGATIGQLDQTALFYMRSRGIPYPTARRMLIRSFLDEALSGVRIDWLDRRIDKIISHRLG